MSGLNGHQHRLWALVMVLVTVLFGAVGWLLAHELAVINTRLDRISDFVLENRKGLHMPDPERRP